jgi:hypothetical protein
MLASEINYLNDLIKLHVHRFFTDEARSAFESVPMRWTTLADVAHPVDQAIYIPTDVDAGTLPDDAWEVAFGKTKLIFWNKLPLPSNEWRVLDTNSPLWYVHQCGAVMPAWNLARTLFDLLTLKEETTDSFRDLHGRFVGKMSPRAKKGLLESPIFNDSVAAIVAACVGLRRTGLPDASLLPGLVGQIFIVLSHDLDQLRGNDIWTQAVRLSRALLPRRGFYPAIRNLWFMLVNAVLPRRYYFDNIVGMIEIERMFGFTSSLYFLNGVGGRFGARSGSDLIPAVESLTPRGWDLGIHYNYDTHLNQKAFDAQRVELESLLGRQVVAGRAHYLRFDPSKSWHFYTTMGIQVDETLGYYDRIGYRAGIAGPFRPYDPSIGSAISLIEMPMVFMEGALVEQYPHDPAGAFEQHLRHISVVGGAISLLFHPGQFNNPEYQETLGLYHSLLRLARYYGARSINAVDFK